MYIYGLFLILLYFGYDVSATVGIEKLLEQGTDLLSKGRYQDALQHFHEAVEKDPKHYMAYYKRGTAYLALGKSKQALEDFDKILEIKEDFIAVRIQRGNVLLKSGDVDKAEHDFRTVLAHNAYHEDAINSLEKVQLARQNIHLAESLYTQGDHHSAISVLNVAIEHCPWSPHLRKLRGKCYMQLGDISSAVLDIRSTTKLIPDHTEGYLELSTLLYTLGNVQNSLEEIRNCLKYDPEHKECFKFYRKVKKIAKLIEQAETASESSNFSDCISKANSVLKQETKEDNVKLIAFRLLCKAHVANSEPKLAVKNCNAALKLQEDIDTLCDTAEAYIAAEMFDDAIMTYKKVLKIDSSNQRAKQGLQRAEQRQKQAETRDYYKILNVPRNANKRQIIKAYRKAAQKWHPDNFPDPEEKKQAEKKFIDIAAAKEVLTDEDKRAKFDAGEDPLDPESGRHQQGFNPFQEFHHFQGSPFQFKFHFN